MEDCKDKPIAKQKDYKVSKQTHIVEVTSAAGDKQYHCTACGKIFGSRSQKYYHLNCNKLQDMIHKCEHCDKSFARFKQWKYHVESHISPVNECSKCQKTFSNPLALKKHEALHNVEPKPCPHCDKTFQKKISLEQHVAAQHLNQLQFGCSYCNKKYASKSTLHLHLQSHEKKRFECTVCGKLFQRNSILNIHLKRHYHTNNYKCAVCQKVFSESGALSRHRKIHEENVLQYHCKLCNKNILRKDNMTRHLNTMHPEEKFKEIVEILTSSPQKSVEEQKIVIETESDIDYLNRKQITNNVTSTQEKSIIIENKLIQKPLQQQESVVMNTTQVSETFLATNPIRSRSIAKEDIDKNHIDLPMINQIQVITPVPLYEKVLISTDHDSTSKHSQPLEYVTLQNFTSNEQIFSSPYKEMLLEIPNTEKSSILQNSSVILQPYKDKIQNPNNNYTQENNVYSQTSDIQNYLVLNDKKSEQLLVKSKNIFTTDISKPLCQETKEQISFVRQVSCKSLPTPAEQSLTKVAPVTQTISSVIKSIGNVKKKLTPTIVTAAKPTPPSTTSNLEYKHKKYCRNNYDIDLYRKILGCDDNDDDDYNNNCTDNNIDIQQQKSPTASNNAMKSSATPVHWRKSFKNNYETSAS